MWKRKKQAALPSDLNHPVLALSVVLACFAVSSFKPHGGERPGVKLRYECKHCKLDEPCKLAHSKARRNEITAQKPATQAWWKGKASEAVETMLFEHAQCHPDLPTFAELNASAELIAGTPGFCGAGVDYPDAS